MLRGRQKNVDKNVAFAFRAVLVSTDGVTNLIPYISLNPSSKSEQTD